VHILSLRLRTVLWKIYCLARITCTRLRRHPHTVSKYCTLCKYPVSISWLRLPLSTFHFAFSSLPRPSAILGFCVAHGVGRRAGLGFFSLCTGVCVITNRGLFRITLFSGPLASFAVFWHRLRPL